MRLSPLTTEGDRVEVSGALETEEALNPAAFYRWCLCGGERNRLFPLLRVVALRTPTSQKRDVGHPLGLLFGFGACAREGVIGVTDILGG
jgi:hypothetical protein